MQPSFSLESSALTRIVDDKPLGFCVLVERLLSIQTSVSVLFERHLYDRRLGLLFQRAQDASKTVYRSLEAISVTGLRSHPSEAADRWLMRLLRVANDPIRLTAHTLSPSLHDLRGCNRAREMACRFIDAKALGQPLAIPGVKVEDLLELPVTGAEQLKATFEIEVVLALQEDLCTEIYDQFIL